MLRAMREQLASGTAVEIARRGEAMGLVIAPDIFGLRPLFDEMVAHLASEHGWTVVAVEPFPEHPDLPDVDARFAAVPELSDARQFADLAAAADLTGCNRVGLIGFCMGGMTTLKAASTGRFDRAAAFYGMIRLPVAWRGDGQGEPLELLAAAPSSTPTLAIIGTEDPYTPPEDVAALRDVPTVTVVEYRGAEHGFVHDPARPSHRPDDAADAWRRTITFLQS
jgi:carboxymethylenebutenolidase